jgi:hypothetical protein
MSIRAKERLTEIEHEIARLNNEIFEYHRARPGPDRDPAVRDHGRRLKARQLVLVVKRHALLKVGYSEVRSDSESVRRLLRPSLDQPVGE